MNSSKKVCKFVVEQEDRISHFPDDLLHYILSFVEFSDVVGLSVLSKRWKNLWTTMPFLDFDIGRFWEARFQYSNLDIEKFRSFINWVLIYQGSSSLTRFRLSSGGLFDYEQVMRWVRIAARRNVQEVEIICDPSEAFELPYSILISQCLRVLRLNLSRCALQLPQVRSNVNFRQLKSLELESVNLTDEFLNRSLFSSCRVLEKLSLKNCMLRWGVLRIASASLKKLIIKNTPQDEVDGEGFCGSTLEISCPNLLSFSYGAPKPERFILGDLSSLEILCLDMYPEYGIIFYDGIAYEVVKILMEVVNIRSLWLKTNAMESLVLKVDMVKHLNTAFQRLKSITLSIGIDARFTQPMFRMLTNCPCLELLTIVLVELSDYDHNWHWQLDDEGSNWWKHHLKSVQLVNFVDDPDEISFVKFILKNGLVLEKFNIIWMDGHTRSVATEKVLQRMPKASTIVAVRFHDSFVDGCNNLFRDFIPRVRNFSEEF